MSGGGSGSTTSTTKNLPSYAEPHVTSFVARGEALADNTTGAYTSDYPYSGVTYVTPNSNETDGIDGLYSRGISGDALTTSGKTYINKVLDGDFLTGLESDFVTAKANALDKPKTAYTTYIEPLLGATVYVGGDTAPDNLAQSFSDSDTKHALREEARIFADNFITERQIQNISLDDAIAYGDRLYIDAEAARLAGVYKREFEHGRLEDIYRQWLLEEFVTHRRKDIMTNVIHTMLKSGQTVKRPFYKPSPMSAIAGGAMAGFAVGGPTGAAVGAGIGLLSTM